MEEEKKNGKEMVIQMASSSGTKIEGETTGLIGEVFSWSLEDVSNEELYKHKVENIPECFQSVGHYLGSFVFPLLEETRAELQASMEVISNAPFAEIISLEEAKPHGSLLYDVRVDSWRNRSGKGRTEAYKLIPGDIFVLTEEVPEIVSDLQRLGRTWNFASVDRVARDDRLMDDVNDAEDDDMPTKFKIKTSKAIEIEEGMRKKLFAVHLINITTNSRVWNALHMLGNLKVLEGVLSPNSAANGVCDLCSYSQTNCTQVRELGMILSSTLNESQTAAVYHCISTMRCMHRSAVELIWGPPGTGKTKTLSTLLWSLLKMNYRTVACAPTNVAIKEVAARVLKLVKEYDDFDMVNSISFLSVGQLLLFGNNDRLKVDDDLEEILLDYRLDKLLECFAPLTGWKHCLTSMRDFLEDCLSQYHLVLENESSKRKELAEESEASIGSDISLVEFTRKRYSALMPPLKGCIRILCTHLPFHVLGQHNFQLLVSLFDLLQTFENFLSRRSIVDKTLEEIFSCAEVVEGAKKCSCSNPFCKKRSECIFILRSLCRSLDYLNKLNLRNKGSVREFCFQNALIIFCTASSSYKLHWVEMPPLDLVVIDEAAQLKECESAIPLQLDGIRHVFLIGDECQLPAMVSSKVSCEAGFGRSLFERMSLGGHPKHLLDMQYRMHPRISCFPNSKFYHNMILDAPDVLTRSYTREYLPQPMFGPYSFINISDGKEEVDDIGHSFKNMVEVAVVMKIVRELFRAWSTSEEELSIGIISPYNAQVRVIHEKIGQKYENLKNFSVKVNSIDGFQGGEEDIIIISTVRGNSSGAIGFLSNSKRTNVALTRAKYCLWILGNGKTLLKSGSIWAELVQDAKDRNCFFYADEDKDLAKAIIEVKKELNQLDDLLKGDSTLFNDAKWKVLFSDNFRKSFGNLNTRTKMSVINLLLRLANGWRPKKRNVDSVSGSSSQLVRQFKVEGFYVVCTVDIVKQSTYTQVLKIWDVLSLEDIPKLIRRLDSISAMYTDDFVNRCNMKYIEGNLEVPMSWASNIEIVRYKDRTEAGSSTSTGTLDGRNFVENSKVSESLLLMKFYSLSAGVVGHLLSGRDGSELDLPFEVTDQELEIILFQRSTFIVGRSGTGKTTVLTMKLIQKEQLHHLSSKGLHEGRNDAYTGLPQKNETGEENKESVLRQMFVTVSPKLCAAIKNHISRLKSFTCGGEFSAERDSVDMHDISDTIEFRDIPDSFADISPDSYPLVITFHKFLMMLDGTIENSFFDRFHDVREHCQGRSGISRSIALHAFIRTKEVTYDRFSSSYWPHFNTQLTKTLDPSTVFTEIISHIKGGLKAGEAHNGKLSREEYVSLSEGRSTLSGQRREIIYEIFLDYEKTKLENGDFDLADFVINLHHRLKDGGYDGEKMDFVYIDEVQDLSMRQIALFKYVCRNYNEGFVFSGDTAQTIARGIDFRFQDIKHLFYKEFLLESGNSSSDKTKDKDQPRVSELFHLNENFRTHAGVLRLSQSVVDLLYRYFPLSIDILKPETSRIYGEAPVLLESGSDENAIVTIFGNSGSSNGSMIGFGAEQVILVRDDSAKKEIMDYVGKQALVLTIVECKGLEFQDVLLYNFFGTSPLKNQWRVVYEYMKEQDLFDSSSPRSFPHFNKVKHNILCSELKQLYVAITRTRQRLWICENIEEVARPMFDYWKKLGLVQVRQLDDSLAQAMQVASSKEEWSARGIKLFKNGNYELAIMCFERAKDLYREKWARAACLRASADRMRDSNSEQARIALVQAAEIYETIDKAELAAKCFIELQEFERAGRLYLEKCGESRLEDAGECFLLAGCWSRAAEVFARGNYFSKCLDACTKGELFDVGLQYIKCWKGNADPVIDSGRNQQQLEEMEQDFLEKCALHYHELKDTRAMMEFVRAFLSMDSIRAFLRRWGYLDELVILEEELGNFMEASSIARIKGDILLEADMLGKGGRFEDSTRLLLLYVLSNSLWGTGGTGWPLKHFPNKDELLQKAKMFAKNNSECFYESVSMEVSILSNQEGSLSDMCKYLSDSQRLENPRVEFIIARKILDSHLQSKPPKYEQEHEVVVNPMKHAADMISQNNVSIGSLIYFWEFCREKILNMIKYLQSLVAQNEIEFVVHGEICLDLLGVQQRVNDVNTTYILLNRDAHWRKEINDKSLKKHGDLVGVDVHLLVSAAQTYWFSEMLHVGIRVLETLEALLDFSTRNAFSIFRQGTCILQIFNVSRCIMESKVLNEKKYVGLSWKFEKFLSLSRDRFFGIVFPPHWRETVMENMVFLRGTNLLKDLLNAVIAQNANSKGQLTHGKVGRMVMMLFESGKLTIELYDMIANYFSQNEPWKFFIEQLKDHMISGSGQGYLAFKLRDALQYTFNANWRVELDYISPHCFIYLLERLLFLVSSCQAKFFTTKSFIIESLACENWLKFSTECVTMSSCHDWIASIANQLIFDWRGTLNWLAKSGFNANQYYKVVVLRLVVLISLIFLNSGLHFNLLSTLLGRNDVRSNLPQSFCEILRGRRDRNFVSILAKALRTIENPLVVVYSGNCPGFICPEAIGLDQERISSREDTIQVLFPKNLKAAQVHVAIEDISSRTTGLGSNDKLPHGSPLTESGDQNLESQNEMEEFDSIKLYNSFWDTFDAIKLVTQGKHDEAMSFLSNAPQIKLKVENSILVLDTAISQLNQNSVGSDENTSMSGELQSMHEELKQLSLTLSASGKELESNMSTMAEILVHLQERRTKLQPLLDSMFLKNDANTSSVEASQGVVASEAESKNNNGKENPNKSKKEKNKKKKGKKK